MCALIGSDMHSSGSVHLVQGTLRSLKFYVAWMGGMIRSLPDPLPLQQAVALRVRCRPFGWRVWVNYFIQV